MVERKPANAQRHARLEDVRVIAKSDACFHSLRACPLEITRSDLDLDLPESAVALAQIEFG
jgi:hypothetical protein